MVPVAVLPSVELCAGELLSDGLDPGEVIPVGLDPGELGPGELDPGELDALVVIKGLCVDIGGLGLPVPVG